MYVNVHSVLEVVSLTLLDSIYYRIKPSVGMNSNKLSC